VIIHNIPENGGEKVNEVVNDLLNELNLEVQVNKCERLGRNFAGRVKSRPIRLKTDTFETKRKILDAARLLKDHATHSNTFISPDLTQSQRQDAFALREEKRRREKAGETNLVIRRGKIVTMQGDHTYAPPLSSPVQSTPAGDTASQSFQ